MKPNRQLLCSLLFVVAQVSGSAVASPMDTQVVTLTQKPDDHMSMYIGLEGNHVVRFTNVSLKAVTLCPPTIADVEINSANELTIRGKAHGGAVMVITDKCGNLLDVNVAVLDYKLLQETLHFIDPRIEFRHRVFDGAEQLVLYGDVDKPETIIRAFSVGKVFMDGRGMNYKVDDESDPVPVRGRDEIMNYDDPRLGALNLISDERRVLSLLALRTR
jgi:Flp pilus assembly secretin CpaC